MVGPAVNAAKELVAGRDYCARCGANASTLAKGNCGGLCRHKEEPHEDCLEKKARNAEVLLGAPVSEEKPEDAVPAVGDIHSEAKGTGARFNNGKVPVEMIPVWIISYVTKLYGSSACDRREQQAWDALHACGEWQRGARPLYDAMVLLGSEALEEAARVFHHATTRPVKPYPMWNWMKGMPWSVPTGCAVRHLLAILRGEENDPETGLPHRGHAMCNLIMLAQYESTYREGDDRPLQYLKVGTSRSAG